MFISEQDREYLKKHFKDNLKDNVEIILFVNEIGCRYCKETKQLLEELSSLSEKIKLEVYNFILDKSKVEEYKIDKTPAIVIRNSKDYGIRFFGIPAGYEFSTLIETITFLSKGETDLPENIKNSLKEIDKDIEIQVFVTPSCPYCPIAVKTAFEFAFENEKIKGYGIEVIEFPDLGQKYNVMGVPKIVINNTVSFEGAVPPEVFLEKIREAEKLLKGG